MSINKLHLIYFSPSGSTEKVVKTIAKEFAGLPVETLDLLNSAKRRKIF